MPFLDRCDLCPKDAEGLQPYDPTCEWCEGPQYPEPVVACIGCRLGTSLRRVSPNS